MGIRDGILKGALEDINWSYVIHRSWKQEFMIQLIEHAYQGTVGFKIWIEVIDFNLDEAWNKMVKAILTTNLE